MLVEDHRPGAAKTPRRGAVPIKKESLGYVYFLMQPRVLRVKALVRHCDVALSLYVRDWMFFRSLSINIWDLEKLARLGLDSPCVARTLGFNVLLWAGEISTLLS